tara:strand:- start:501 stop:722 length:222 start_codon:yes stop_codon:yes gene_type:complete
LGTVRATEKRLHGQDRHTVIGAISGALEEQMSSPVVGEVLGHLTCGASCMWTGTDVSFHGGVKGISTNDFAED